MANQVSSQTLRASRAAGDETQGRGDFSPIHESSSDIADQARYTCACGSMYELQPTKLHFCTCPPVSFSELDSSASSDTHMDTTTPYSIAEFDRSPTLVPCNSPALTPAQSLSHMPMESSPPPPSSTEISSEDCPSPELSFFNMSLVSDTSEDDDEFHLPSSLDLDDDADDDLFYAPLEAPRRRSSAANAAYGLGLAITGVARKDGSGPFDGLGLLALRPTAWRTHAADADGGAYHDFAAGADGNELSATFRAEALRTFADDPCHTHTLGAIPECGEWYAAQGRDADADGEGESECASVEERGAATCFEHGHGRRAQRGARLSPGFSAETISSAMKRSSSRWVGGVYADGEGRARRARAATWPTRSGTTTTAPSLSPQSSPKLLREVQRVWRV